MFDLVVLMIAYEFRYMPDFIDNQKMTITDIVEKSLKKGKGSEIKAAAKLSILLAIQVFDPEEVSRNKRAMNNKTLHILHQRFINI